MNVKTMDYSQLSVLFPQDVKPNMKQVQSSATIATTADGSSDASIDMVEIDGAMVKVHEDLKELYSDEAQLTRMMKLRQTPMGTFADCGDIHSLDGWGTKGESPTIRMQIEQGVITLEDTLQKTGQPGQKAPNTAQPAMPAKVNVSSSKSVSFNEMIVWPCLGVEYYVVDGQLKEKPIQAA
jgi:hypothetical protein